MAAPGLRWPAGLRQSILERDSYTCRIGLPGCTRHATEIDHIIPRKAGGAYYDEHNLRAACKNCNLKRRQLPGAYPTPTLTTLSPEYW